MGNKDTKQGKQGGAKAASAITSTPQPHVRYYGSFASLLFEPKLAQLKKSAATNTRVLFVGNPGSGKSTLLNSLLQDKQFKSGLSVGTGLTAQMSKKIAHGGVEFLDTPGFSDTQKREQAAVEIKKALSADSNFYLFFVIVLNAGRIAPDDLSTMKLVLDALEKVPNRTYGIIINKVSAPLLTKLRDPAEMNKLKVDLVTLPIRTTHLFFFPKAGEADDQDDFLLPRHYDFERFLLQAQPFYVKSKEVLAIQTDLFEQFKQKMKEETDALRSDNEKLQKQIVEMQTQMAFLRSSMDSAELSARASQAVQQKSEETIWEMAKDFESDIVQDLHNVLKGIVGDDRWTSAPWVKLRKAIDHHLDTKGKTYVETLGNPAFTIDMFGAFAYYTSDLRCFGGERDSSLFAIINPVLTRTTNFRHLPPAWKQFLNLAFRGYDLLPKFSGACYRGLDRALYDVEKYLPGYEVTYMGFTSCTTDAAIINSFSFKDQGTWLILRCENGVALHELSLFPSESEILFMPGASFKVQTIVSREMKKLTNIPEQVDVFEFVQSGASFPEIEEDRIAIS